MKQNGKLLNSFLVVKSNKVNLAFVLNYDLNFNIVNNYNTTVLSDLDSYWLRAMRMGTVILKG